MIGKLTIDMKKKASEFTDEEICELIEYLTQRLKKVHRSMTRCDDAKTVQLIPGVPTLLLLAHALITAMQMRTLKRVATND